MADRRWLIAVVLFALAMHGLAIGRTVLPAQDGLKVIAVAREFGHRPWEDVVRGTDLHPLYPALIAALHPFVAAAAGPGPTSWRLTAQLVSALASVLLIFPVHRIARILFDRRIALLAAALVVLYPHMAELGHETLADSVGLLGIFSALWFGICAWLKPSTRLGALSGVVAGLGYLARPEAILVPPALALAWLMGMLQGPRYLSRKRFPGLVAIALAFGAVLCAYAAIKGEISEKLALRLGASLGKSAATPPHAIRSVPPGLDDPRLDFSPKEESDTIRITGAGQAAAMILREWWEESCWFFAVMAGWGWARRDFIRGLCPELDPDASRATSRILLVFSAIYFLALLRHSTVLGYLSGRHTMALLIAAAPWAAAGSFVCARGVAVKCRLLPARALWLGVAASALLIMLSVITQVRPKHRGHWSREAHLEAGRWLAQHAADQELVLDTRGWARFISGKLGYDYWHVRQALTDAHLRYIVVERDELEAPSPRARTLRRLLDRTARVIAEFPDQTRQTAAVRVYRFERPGSWEVLRR